MLVYKCVVKSIRKTGMDPLASFLKREKRKEEQRLCKNMKLGGELDQTESR